MGVSVGDMVVGEVEDDVFEGNCDDSSTESVKKDNRYTLYAHNRRI